MSNITIFLFVATLLGFAVTFGCTIYLIFKIAKDNEEE